MQQDPVQTDWSLLDRYAAGDPAAFEPLVQRHLNLVYNTARRMLGGPGTEADDVTQAVFLLLSQRARRLSRRGVLAGWLYRATAFCCRNVRKTEGRRRRHAREAANMIQTSASTSTSESPAAAALDDALQRLGEKERAAVLVRYLEGKSAAEAGRELGISEDAAEKRAERALAKLRRYFAAKGFAVPAAGVAGLLVTEAATAAPAMLATSVLTTVGMTGTTGTAALIAKGASHMMTWAKVKSGIAICVAAAATGAGVLLLAQHPQARPIVIGAPVPAGRRAMMVRWDMVTNAAGAQRVIAALRPAASSGVGYAAYQGDALALRAALAERPADVLLRPARPGWASMNDAFGSQRGSDFGLESQALTGPGISVDKANNLVVVVSTRSTGPASAAPIKDAVHLDLSKESHDLMALMNDQTPEVIKPVKFGYTGDVKTGEAVVFAGEIVTKAGMKLMHLSVWEAFSASEAEFAYLRQAGAEELVDRGIGDALANADQAIAWAAAGKKNPDAVAKSWERKLASGGIVRLVGVSRPGSWPDCWWDAQGRPVAWDPRWDVRAGASSASDVVVAVSAEDPAVKDPRGLQGYGSASRQLLALKVGDTGGVDVGASAGPWTDAGRAEVGKEVTAGGLQVMVGKPEGVFHRSGNSPGTTWIHWEAERSPEVEIRIVVLDQKGHAFGEPSPPQLVPAGGTVGRGKQQDQAAMQIDVDDIGGYAVQWRKREWVHFDGFAAMPVEMPGGPATTTRKAAELVSAGTPEAFMAAFREAVQSGKVEKVRALMAAEGGVSGRYADTMAEELASRGALWTAAVKRFGEEECATALAGVAGLPDAHPPEGMTWEISGETAKLVNAGHANIVMTGGPMAGLVKVKGAWRANVAMPELTAEQAKELEGYFSQAGTAAAKRRAVAAEVAAGKYKDAYGVRDAVGGP